MGKLDQIAEIEVEAKYGDDEYEVEIEKDSDEPYTSEIKDELNDKNAKGQDAFDELYPMVKDLGDEINADISDESLIKETLKVFDLKDDYDEIEVEIDLKKSGDELEAEDK